MKRRIPRFAALGLACLAAGALLALFVTVTAASHSAVIYPLTRPELNSLPLDDAASAADPTAFLPLRATAVYTLPDPSWRIGITADGLYRLSYETLEAAGVPVTATAPSAYHLLWRGQDVALQEVGTGDGTFDPGDGLLFYAVKFHGPVEDEQYTDENVYWLTVLTGTPGLRMGTRSVAPAGGGEELDWYTATVHAEQNPLWWARHSNSPGTQDTWFWESIHVVFANTTRTYELLLTDLASSCYTALLRLEVAGRTYHDSVYPDHHLRLSVNSTAVGEVTWDGKVGAVFTLPVPSAALVSGVNRVKVVVLTDLYYDQWVYMNWAEISFRRAFVAEVDRLAWTAHMSGSSAVTLTGFSTSAIHLYDITHPLVPTRLVSATAALSGSTYALALSDASAEGTAYLAVAEDAVTDVPSLAIYYPPADLIGPAQGADEIVIAPAGFITALQPLVDQRRAQGLRIRVVSVEDIYALFNGGVFHPEAIRAFVAYAYENWPGPPVAYLLLVGDGNWNLKGYNPALYGNFVPTLIPPYLEFADPDQGQVPVDSRFGDVDGDGMPEVSVGRIPAGSAAQVEQAVAKILTYESAPPDAWTWRLLMAADNGKVSPEGFEQILDDLVEDFVPVGADVRRVYLREYCTVGTCIPATTALATQALTWTWSQGAVLLAYAGHGAIDRWANEPLLSSAQLRGLTGTQGLPFIISLDCWDGYWLFPPKFPGVPDTRSMGEWATTVLTDRGAIAVFGPAGMGYAAIEAEMTRAMAQALFEGHTVRLGPLTQAGREAISWSYMARTYTLLGDPAMALFWWDHLAAAPAWLTMTAGTSITPSSTFAVTGTAGAGRVFAVTPTWTVDAGVWDGWRYTAPTQVMEVHLTAIYGPISTVVTVTIVPDEPVTVTVSPDPLQITVGETAQMAAAFADRWGNPVMLTPAWSADIGQIDVGGFFTAPLNPGRGWITATAAGLTARVNVEVRMRLFLPLVLRGAW